MVVVDDGSTDGTVETLVNQEARYSKVRLFQQEHAGATEARNLGMKYFACLIDLMDQAGLSVVTIWLGIRQAKGSVIVFIDSDMVVTETFLSSHAKALRDSQTDDSVSGRNKHLACEGNKSRTYIFSLGL